MNVDPKLEVLIGKILERESSSAGGNVAVAAEQATNALGHHLRRLFGNAGSRALFDRTLVQIKEEFPFLENVVSTDQGELAGLSEAAGGDVKEAKKAFVALLARLLTLLTALLGEDLTQRIVWRTWPEDALDEASPQKKELA